jgi:hypothetical protein
VTFGVFIHRSDSIYDDIPAEPYQFPLQYLGRVQACADDWIIYYEPVKVSGARGYFAPVALSLIASWCTAIASSHLTTSRVRAMRWSAKAWSAGSSSERLVAHVSASPCASQASSRAASKALLCAARPWVA